MRRDGIEVRMYEHDLSAMHEMSCRLHVHIGALVLWCSLCEAFQTVLDADADHVRDQQRVPYLAATIALTVACSCGPRYPGAVSILRVTCKTAIHASRPAHARVRSNIGAVS